MSYIINNSRGQVVAVVADGTINTSATSLALVGRAVSGYGTSENENYLFLLENFANSSAPTNPILGQLWYNSSTDTISAYNSLNAWTALASQQYVEDAKISPVFTGIPEAPTAVAGTATTQIATTAFVTNSPQFAGAPRAPTATAGTANTQIATTAFVTNSPQFAGVPTAPTAAAGTNTTQIATTAFVTAGPDFAGSPTSPTLPAVTNTTQLATTAFVQNNKVSPAFTGTPTAPTAVIGTNTTQIATTAFVQAVAGNLGTMSTQNASSVNITGGTITGITPLAVADGGTGASTATQARTNLGVPSTTITITANGGLTGGGDLSANRTISIAPGSNGFGTRYVSSSSPVGGSDGDIWYQI